MRVGSTSGVSRIIFGVIQLVYDSENRSLEAVPRPLENGNDRQEEVLRGTEGAGPMDGTEAHVNFDTPAVLRKWPSLYKQRRTEGTGPYLLVDGTLDDCIRQYMAKPASMRHLYEIHTSPQRPLVPPILSREHVIELARLQFLESWR